MEMYHGLAVIDFESVEEENKGKLLHFQETDAEPTEIQMYEIADNLNNDDFFGDPEKNFELVSVSGDIVKTIRSVKEDVENVFGDPSYIDKALKEGLVEIEFENRS